MENYNKVITAVLATLITSFIIGGLTMYGKYSSLESTTSLRPDYIEKKLEDSITVDKLENAKLQLSQQVAVHCK